MPFSEIHLSQCISPEQQLKSRRVELCVHVFDFLMIGTHVYVLFK